MRWRALGVFSGIGRFTPVALWLTAALAIASAQPSLYPNRTVQMIIAYGAGSAGDLAMRILADGLDAKLSQSFIVVNKPGAGGVAAALAAATAAPDGYTLMLNGNVYAISAALFRSLPYNIVTDFASVSLVASFDMLVLAKAGSPLKSVGDIIAYAKANPGKLNVGGLAPGTTEYLAAYLLKIITGTDFTVVPFRTSPDLATALLRGDVDVALEFYAPMQALIADKTIVAIAAAGSKRQYFLPEVPTTLESGLAGFDVSSWNAISVPAGTPKPIIDNLNRAIVEVLQAPAVQEKAHRLGLEMRGSTPDELTAKVNREIAKWRDVVAKANIPKMD